MKEVIPTGKYAGKKPSELTDEALEETWRSHQRLTSRELSRSIVRMTKKEIDRRKAIQQQQPEPVKKKKNKSKYAKTMDENKSLKKRLLEKEALIRRQDKALNAMFEKLANYESEQETAEFIRTIL